VRRRTRTTLEVVDAAAPPKANGEDFEGKPTGVVGGPPNTLPSCSGGNNPAWSFFSLSSADFVVAAPNMLLEPPKEPPVVVVVSLNNFDPGATLKEKGRGADEAGLSFSLSLSSEVDLSEPKSGTFFGELLKSKVLVAPPLPLPPKQKGADSFIARDVASLSEDGAPVEPENGDDDKVDACLDSEDAAVVDEKPKGDGCDVDDAGLGVNPVPGVAELVGAAKPAKLVGGTGITVGAEVADLKGENEGTGTDGLLGGLGALVCVFT